MPSRLRKKTRPIKTSVAGLGNPLVILGYLLFVFGIIYALINFTDWPVIVLIFVGYWIIWLGGFRFELVERYKLSFKPIKNESKTRRMRIS